MHGFIVTIKKIDFSVELSIKKSEAYFLDKHTNRSNQNTISDNFGFFTDSPQLAIGENQDYNFLIFGRIYSNAIKNHVEKSNINILANLLTQYKPEDIAHLIDGDFFIFIYDKIQEKHTFITDKGGFIPAYVFENEKSFVITSHPDAITYTIGREEAGPLDLISMAEFLNTSRIEFPNTYYQRIKQLSPGSIFEIYKTELTSNAYWTPKAEFSYDKEELTHQLATAIQTSVREATDPIYGSHGIFLSGGADSRAILFSRHQDAKLSAATFFDHPNDEFFTAKQLAQRAGVPHIGLQREFEHYGNSAIEYVKTTQGMMALADNHYISFLEKIASTNIDNWHTGCFADWFFKGIAFNTSYKTILGKPLPTWQIFSNFNYVFHTYECPIHPNFDLKVKERLQIRYKNVLTNPSLQDDALWEIEKLRLWPINREFTFGSRMSLSAFLNWHPIISRESMLDMWRKIPPSYKLNGLIWKKAVAKICQGNNDIKDNNWGSYLGYSPQINTFFFLLKVIERKFQKNKSIPTGSWPNFRNYIAKSQVFDTMWNDSQNYSSGIFTQILGYNPFDYPSSTWAEKDVIFFTRLISLHLWLKLYNLNFEK